MDASTDLVAAVGQLAASAGLGSHGLTARIESFVDLARLAVPSFQGLRVGLVDHGHEVVLTAFVEQASAATIRTTVRVPLHALGPSSGWGSSLVLYAGVPGAFVDLGADLAHALGLPLRTGRPEADPVVRARQDGQERSAITHGTLRLGPAEHAVVLDHDPLPSAAVSTLSGLDERMSIDRAVGVLLDRGHSVETAHLRLWQLAATHGTSVGRSARAVLQSRSW